MNLSDIVRYLNHLDTLSVREAASTAVKEVAKIIHIVQNSEIQMVDIATSMELIQTEIDQSLCQFEQQLDQLRTCVQTLIEHQEIKYFADSTENYQRGMTADTPTQILQRARPISPETEQLLRSRVIRYTDWRFPGMVIRPAHGIGIENLVALDPLYLVDTHPDLLDPIRELFTLEYQRRLRYYVVNENTSEDIFWNLPRAQFGLVYAFQYFETKPWEVLQRYLNEIFVLLRPGGVFFFSYNDCDQWRSVGSTEHYVGSYTPGRLVHKHIQELGYEIINQYYDQANISWLEIRKPGEPDSIRGAQALARPLIKTVDPVVLEPKVIDKPAEELYNDLDLDMLIDLAKVLGVNISEAKTKNEFNIKKVRRTVHAYLESQKYPEEYLQKLFTQRKNK